MPKNFNSNDLSILTRLGIVNVEGGVYKVIKAVAGHKPNDTISKERATELAEFFTPPMSELDRVLIAVPSHSSSSQDSDDDYYPDYEAEDLEDAEDD